MSIAVVIPAYNSARLIGATILSVLEQSLPADEIIVVDDGSTDDTAAVAESFGPGVKVFRCQNGGQAAARTFGTQLATSDWISYLDHDDLWDPRKLERQMEELVRHSADFCLTGRINFSETDGHKTFGRVFPGCPIDAVRERFFAGEIPYGSAVMVRRSAVLALGGFRTDLRICDDWDMWLRLYHAGAKFASCPEPLHLYRIHRHNASSNRLLMYHEQVRVYKEQVLPYLPTYKKWFEMTRFYSVRKGEVAYRFRQARDSRYALWMGQSILHWPFDDLYRYKVFAHMVLTRLGLLALPPTPESRSLYEG
jgi:glycosyltransferase involved in cell wall biosynthesis